MKRECSWRHGSQGFGPAQSKLSVGKARTQFVPSHPSMSQMNQFQSQSAIQAPLAAQTDQRGHIMGRGQGQGSPARTLRTQGRVYAIVPQAERAYQLDMQGTFSYLHLLSNASCSLLHLV